MTDVYGEKAGSGVRDEEWLKFAGENDLVVLMKDKRIMRRPAEKAALMQAGVRAFCVMNGNLTGAQQIDLISRHLPAIVRAAGTPGPYIYGIYEARIKRKFP